MTEPRSEQRIEERTPVPLLDLDWSSSSNVLNLSRLFVPSSAQLGLLEKGLTFSPKPFSFSRELLRRDLHHYHRRTLAATSVCHSDGSATFHGGSSFRGTYRGGPEHHGPTGQSGLFGRSAEENGEDMD